MRLKIVDPPGFEPSATTMCQAGALSTIPLQTGLHITEIYCINSNQFKERGKQFLLSDEYPLSNK